MSRHLWNLPNGKRTRWAFRNFPVSTLNASRQRRVCYTLCGVGLGKDGMDIANVVAALKEERGRIDQAIAALEGLASPARRGRPPRGASTTGGPRPHMSTAARKRISAAMKRRWAKWHGKSAPKPAKSRPRMSAAARKKLSALMKARWAAKQKAKA